MKHIAKNLVCQYFEGLSRKALEDYSGLFYKYIKGRHGIYALYRNDKLYYVGLATDIKSRLRNHFNDRHAKTWNRFSIYFTVGDDHLRELEALLLRIVPTDGNTQKGKFAKAQNLNRLFQKEMHDFNRNEEHRIMGHKAVHKEINQDDEASLPLAQYITKRTPIRMIYKGTPYTAAIRKDGSIVFTGKCAKIRKFAKKVFNTPSAAGVAVTGKPTNGWVAWSYERAPGDWVELNFMRLD